MPKLEFFFDYSCPYCLKGYNLLLELLPDFPGLEVEWFPCEAHPRPETYGPHSDLCIEGMYFAKEAGADLWAYHDRMYRLALGDRVNIEDADTLARHVGDLLDADAFRAALLEHRYARQVVEGNAYAYEQNGVWAVPSYRMDGRKLDARENVGVSTTQLRGFLREVRA